MANFSCLPLQLNAVITEQVFRPIGILNRSAQWQHARVKYKYIFDKASSLTLSSSLLNSLLFN